MVGEDGIWLMGQTTLDAAFEAFVAGVHERGPTARDFASLLGLASTDGAHLWTLRLVRAGFIERVPRNTSGYYRLTAYGREVAEQSARTSYVRSAS